MELKLCIYLLFCISSLGSASGDPCEAMDTCSKCITHTDCVWCAQIDFGKKCISKSSSEVSKCTDLQEKKSIVEVMENKTFTSTLSEVVQLTPQRIKIDLRVGQPTSFSFKFMQAKDYPVDLYFLLDASYSMSKVRDELKKQSLKIREVMQSFTRHIRLGLGTFVDKNAMPYVQDSSKNEVYSFRHHLMTDNVAIFKKALDDIKFVENFDAPEGGLDGLAQVLACSEGSQNIIEWSKHSRKFVLFITDDQFHAAGDGVLAGIHQPYDGKCYTTKNGTYTKELKMDYPSVSMIRKLAKKIEANLIFIISEKQQGIYFLLNDYLGGILKTYNQNSVNAGRDNFDDKLREAYEDKTKHINLKTSYSGNIDQDQLSMNFTPNCKDCSDCTVCEIHENKEIQITGTITLNTYKEQSKNFTVYIVVDGIKEKLQLDVNVITNCDCEMDVNKVKDSPICSGNGTLVCGLCNCNENRYGSKCKCNSPDEETDLSLCIGNDKKVCSGNGKCECGTCKCDNRGGEETYSGQFCQCDANSCRIGSNGKQCSGHGECVCGSCKCQGNWDGSVCETSTLKTNCMKDNKECNGRGTCFNNACKCAKAPEWDARQTFDSLCGILPETGQNQCKLLENHARCAHYKDNSCPDEDSVKVNLTKGITETEKTTMNICDDVRVGPGCYIQFGYKYNDEDRTIQLVVEEEANCQENFIIYGSATLATLIIAGICTLACWKILTTRRDRKEYELFLKSTDMNRQSSVRKNVLYASPKTTIDNPTYENKCD